ncbi:MAG: PDZ domain-containing protein [Ferruginibacter sp.]
MARFPDYDSTARIFNGASEGATSKERVAGWKNPAGGYLHALHQGEWGGFHFLITSKNTNGELVLEGGWQNNRSAPLHPKYRFVENIFEELDAPGEWFYNSGSKTLYVYPPTGSDIHKENFYVSRLNDLLVIKGDSANPVKNVTISNICFTATNRTFMLTKEPLLRSDWTIYRGGAVLLDGTENIAISNCKFESLGGNAVFLSNYNRKDSISNNHIFNIGGSAISFVGNANAVRSPLFNYNQSMPWAEIDLTPGPLSGNYPSHCVANGNLIHDIGQVEKQVAGIEISMSSGINVSHNTIYHVPRAGINIGDGCWGGDTIEFNDVFNTVLETGDHGAFNSWGRDRFWNPDRQVIDSIVAAKPGLELLDVVEPIVIRNNRFQCDHGWDIDLDDGSSNYKIYNNICLSGGLKLREGYHRTVTNNIIINNTFHPHVWLKNSGDVFTHNIVTSAYAPILMNNWGNEIDSNFFLFEDGLEKSKALGLDENSRWGDPLFINAKQNNYRLKAGSPALKVGFENFNGNFGVTSINLKKIAEKPSLRTLQFSSKETKGKTAVWLGATIKNIETLGERSAAGLHNNEGALIAGLPSSSLAAKSKLQNGDIIIALGDVPVKSLYDLLQVYQKIKWMGKTECTIMRNQSEQKIDVLFKE